MKDLRAAIILIVATAVAAGQSPRAAAQAAYLAPAQPDDYFNVLIGDQFAYDNNLFRLPDSFNIAAVRGDHINSALIGFDTQYSFLHQDIRASLRVNNNRFAQNDELNNTSGTAAINMDWLVSSRLTGTVGMDFSRAQANFADTFFFEKDLVDTTDYFATAQLRFAQHWQLTGGFTESDTTHSAQAREEDEIRGRYSNVGIQYVTSENNLFGFLYSYSRATRPFLSFFDGEPFNSAYIDNSGQLTVKYAFSPTTQLKANGGYIRRRYPYADIGSFSGTTWRVTLTSQITGKTSLSAAAWRELTAYLDAATDYFVSRGESLTATWDATAKVSVSLTGQYMGQDYIDTSTSALLYDQRHDVIRSAQAGITYAPVDSLHLVISYRFENRGSTIPQFGYADRVASAQLSYQFL
jgi:putative beta-barrel porin BBP2